MVVLNGVLKASGVKLGIIGFLLFLSFYLIPLMVHQISSVDGGYTQWSAWSACFKTCGESMQGRYYIWKSGRLPNLNSRVRNCLNPKPSRFGRDCSRLGPYFDTRKCELKKCPVNGKFGPWTDWTECDKPCKDGKHKRTRKCDSPAPAFGGKNCEGPLEEEQICLHLRPCPIDGKFSEWSPWTACSVTCGKGHRSRKRECNSPAPQWGGANCVGVLQEVPDCIEKPCSTEAPATTKLKETPTPNPKPKAV